MTDYLWLLLAAVALCALGLSLHAARAGARAHRALATAPSRLPHVHCSRCQRWVETDGYGRPLPHAARADRPYGPDCGPRVIS